MKAVEEAKEALEAEMKKLRVQTEQWRKAADAAAAVLAGDMEMNGRIYERSSLVVYLSHQPVVDTLSADHRGWLMIWKMVLEVESERGHLWGKNGQK
jgi:hypothetical protein